MSFTRFLVYANDLRIEGLVATTSTWQRTAVRPIAAYEDATHNPRVRANGLRGTEPVTLDAQVGQPVPLSAAGTRDPDRDTLHYTWFAYPEAVAGTGQSRAVVSVENADGPTATVTPTSTCAATWLNVPCTATTGVAHVILAVTDDGSPSLTSYRRVVVKAAS